MRIDGLHEHSYVFVYSYKNIRSPTGPGEFALNKISSEVAETGGNLQKKKFC